jgi:hypothetical protein
MNDSTVVTFTGRGIERLLKEGGTKSWVLDAKRVRKTKYVVCVQNRDQVDNHGDDWGKASAQHKEAFFVGKIADVILVEAKKDVPKRWLIKVNEYAEINIPNMWTGNRNPVSYTSLTELGIKEEDLIFKLMPEVTEPIVNQILPNGKEVTEVDYSEGLTIKEAKTLLSIKYDTSEDNIEIVIKG